MSVNRQQALWTITALCAVQIQIIAFRYAYHSPIFRHPLSFSFKWPPTRVNRQPNPQSTLKINRDYGWASKFEKLSARPSLFGFPQLKHRPLQYSSLSAVLNFYLPHLPCPTLGADSQARFGPAVVRRNFKNLRREQASNFDRGRKNFGRVLQGMSRETNKKLLSPA